MRIEELRINDVYRCKTDDANIVRFVSEMNNKGELILNKVGGDDWETLEATIRDIVPVDANDATFKAIGAVKGLFGVEYTLMIGDKEFFIRKDVNSPLWIWTPEPSLKGDKFV